MLVFGANALPSATPAATPVTRDPYSARWVCPLLGGLTTPVTIANVGEATASLRTTVRGTGKSAAPATQELAGGKTQQLSLKPAKAGFVQVESFSAPVVVSAPGLGCAPGPGNRWWLPASDTRFGTETNVIIANPDSQPATVDLVPHLTSGSIRPDEREVFIKPGEAVVRPLGDEAPTGLKPSIEVVARAGRVVVGAAVSSGGRAPTLLPAQGAAKPEWSFAGGISGGGRQAQVLVTNPNPTPLQVELQITTAKATFRPEGDFDEPIANGGTAELAIPALDVKGPFAVRVRSTNGAPFVAALRVTQGDGNQISSRIDLGTGQSGERLAGPWHPRRRQAGAGQPVHRGARGPTGRPHRRRQRRRSGAGRARPGRGPERARRHQEPDRPVRLGRAGGGATGRRPDRPRLGHRRPPRRRADRARPRGRPLTRPPWRADRTPARRLARRLPPREVSAAELLAAHLDRLEAVNPLVNAVVRRAPDALDRARAADQALARGEEPGPLHGVPFTAKDNLETRGVVTAIGVPERAGTVPPADATAVARLRAAGGILLGKTNCPPRAAASRPTTRWTAGPTTPTTGRSDPGRQQRRRGRGGGGRRCSPCGLGTDSGGSLRVPAHFCGVATLKPTNGLVPVTGVLDDDGPIGALSDPRTQARPDRPLGPGPDPAPWGAWPAPTARDGGVARAAAAPGRRPRWRACAVAVHDRRRVAQADPRDTATVTAGRRGPTPAPGAPVEEARATWGTATPSPSRSGVPTAPG